MILIDFAEKIYYNISPDFGIDTLYRIETIMKLVNDKNNPQKEEIAIITGGFHYKEKYEIWNNSHNKINLDYKLMEHVIVLDKLNFIRMLKSGLPLEVKNKQILESCSLDKSIISYENILTKMNYTLVDFEKNTTKRIEYDILSGKQTLFEYNNILSRPVLMDKKLYSIETLVNERYAILDLQTNEFIFILSLGEKILSVDNHIILTYSTFAAQISK